MRGGEAGILASENTCMAVRLERDISEIVVRLRILAERDDLLRDRLLRAAAILEGVDYDDGLVEPHLTKRKLSEMRLGVQVLIANRYRGMILHPSEVADAVFEDLLRLCR